MSAGELETLAATADAADAEAGAAAAPAGEPGQAAPAAPEFGNFEAVGMLLAMTREALALALDVKTPHRVMTDAKIEPLAHAWAAVADHYGLSLASWTAGPLGLALVQTVPMALALYQGLKDELQAKRTAPRPVDQAQPAADA